VTYVHSNLYNPRDGFDNICFNDFMLLLKRVSHWKIERMELGMYQKKLLG
jgi:hypothetical protein